MIKSEDRKATDILSNYFTKKRTKLTSKLALLVGFKTRKRFNKFSQSVDI